ncbi:hypothetical protein V1520DRAFT_328597 [Lipomyces starkeyi]
MTTTNKAAWMPAKKVKPLVASWWSRTVQWPSTHSTGLSIGDLLLPNVKYPFILGSNVAGTVVEVGPGVDRFRVGDGQTAGYDKTVRDAGRGRGPALYGAPRRPDGVRDSAGLNHGGQRPVPPRRHGARHAHRAGALSYRRRGEAPRSYHHKAARPASAATPCSSPSRPATKSFPSPKNHTYVKRLGASHVFDYRNHKLVQDILVRSKGRSLAVADGHRRRRRRGVLVRHET